MSECLSELSRSSDLSGRALRIEGNRSFAMKLSACRSRSDDRNEYCMGAAKERNNMVQVQVQLHKKQ